MDAQRQYTEEEAEEILRVATRESSQGVSRERLLEMASELGVSPETLESAERQVLARKEDMRLRREFSKIRWKAFWSNFWSFLFINAGFLFWDYRNDGRLTFSLWILVPWAIGVVGQLYSNLNRTGDGYEKAFREWREKESAGEGEAGELRDQLAAASTLDTPKNSQRIVIGLNVQSSKPDRNSDSVGP